MSNNDKVHYSFIKYFKLRLFKCFANYIKKYKNLNVKGYASTSYPDIWWFGEWSEQTALPGYIPH